METVTVYGRDSMSTQGKDSYSFLDAWTCVFNGPARLPKDLL